MGVPLKNGDRNECCSTLSWPVTATRTTAKEVTIVLTDLPKKREEIWRKYTLLLRKVQRGAVTSSVAVGGSANREKIPRMLV